MNESDLERRIADVLTKRSEDAMSAVHVEEDLDTLRRRAKREARWRRTGLVAAVLVILVAGGALLLPEQGASAPDSADAAGPSPSAEATPTTGAWTWHFAGTDSNVTIAYTLPDGWEPTDYSGLVDAPNARVNFWEVRNVYADGCRWTLQDPPLGPTVDDLATVWAGLPGFTATTPVDVTVDGYAGKRVDYVLPDYGAADCLADKFGVWVEGNTTGASPNFWAQVPEQQNRQWILDVDGNRLVINEWSRPGTTPEQLADMDEFLASVQITSVKTD